MSFPTQNPSTARLQEGQAQSLKANCDSPAPWTGRAVCWRSRSSFWTALYGEITNANSEVFMKGKPSAILPVQRVRERTGRLAYERYQLGSYSLGHRR